MRKRRLNSRGGQTARFLVALVPIWVLMLGVVSCGSSSAGRPADAADIPGASDSARLVRFSDIESDIAQARTVTLSAYSLSQRSRIVRDLLVAAHHATYVSVALTASGMGFAVRNNEETAIVLRAAGIRVHLLAQPIHMKAIIVDAARIYVSDRNWTSRGAELILALPPRYRITVERAIEGQATSLGDFTTRKDESLARQDAVLASGQPVVVETESFSVTAAPVGTLERIVRSGGSVMLIVAQAEYARSSRERGELAKLAHEGVAVRVSRRDEKIAVGPLWAWCGSANMSGGVPSQIDWGFATRDPALVAALRAQLSRNASEATPVN